MNTVAQTPRGDASPPSEQKKALRQQVRAALADLSAADRAERSARVCERVGRCAYLATARCVMLYAPMPVEVDLSPIIRGCLDAGVRIALPRIDWESGTMDPAEITDWPSGLVETHHGIREPLPGAPTVDLDALDLIVVPGLAFDLHGSRLGRGAGYYDRFLSRPGLVALRVGVAFDAQIVERVPVRAWSRTVAPDARMHAVFTERRMILGTDPFTNSPETCG